MYAPQTTVITMPKFCIPPDLGCIYSFTGRVSQGDNDTVTYHYLLEASKFSNSHLMKLGDPEFNPNAHVVSGSVYIHM